MESKSKAKKILVVEDEKAYARALALKLQHEGFDVQNAYDGEEAINFLKNSDFDLVMLDIVMPKINGFGVLEEMRNLGVKNPVIILSNLSQDEDKKKIKEYSVKDFIEKSNITIADVISKVKNHLI